MRDDGHAQSEYVPEKDRAKMVAAGAMLDRALEEEGVRPNGGRGEKSLDAWLDEEEEYETEEEETSSGEEETSSDEDDGSTEEETDSEDE